MITVHVPRPKGVNSIDINLNEEKANLIEALDVANDLNDRLHNALTANAYQREALRTASGMNDKYPMWLNGVLGLSGESGECADMVKKYLFQGHDLDKEHLAKELGDVAWYVAVTAHAIGYTLEDVLRMNMNKLRARYPEGFSAEKSLHRKEGDV